MRFLMWCLPPGPLTEGVTAGVLCFELQDHLASWSCCLHCSPLGPASEHGWAAGPVVCGRQLTVPLGHGDRVNNSVQCLSCPSVFTSREGRHPWFPNLLRHVVFSFYNVCVVLYSSITVIRNPWGCFSSICLDKLLSVTRCCVVCFVCVLCFFLINVKPLTPYHLGNIFPKEDVEGYSWNKFYRLVV